MIEIKEDVKVGDIILEAGDEIEILKEEKSYEVDVYVALSRYFENKIIETAPEMELFSLIGYIKDAAYNAGNASGDMPLVVRYLNFLKKEVPNVL